MRLRAVTNYLFRGIITLHIFTYCLHYTGFIVSSIALATFLFLA